MRSSASSVSLVSGRLGQPGNRRNRRPGPEVDHRALPLEETRAVVGRHLDPAGSHEPRPADDELHPALPKLVEVHHAHRPHDRLRPPAQRGRVLHVHRRRNAELAGATGQLDDLGRADQRLARDARKVDAGAPDHLRRALDHRDPPTGVRHVHRERLPALTARDDQQLKALHTAHVATIPQPAESSELAGQRAM